MNIFKFLDDLKMKLPDSPDVYVGSYLDYGYKIKIDWWESDFHYQRIITNSDANHICIQASLYEEIIYDATNRYLGREKDERETS